MLQGLLPDAPALIVFMVATISLNLTPGQDMMYVMGNSVGSGARAGVAAAFGVGGGCVVHTLAAALGLSAVLVSSPVAYDAIRYLGAAYLVYLGVRAVAGAPERLEARSAGAKGMLPVFRQGVVTNVLNPKVALFFLAFLPQFVDPSRGLTVWQFILLGTIFNVSGTTVNVLVALASGRVGDWLRRSPTFARAQQWVSGAVFVALGARIALAR